MIEHPHSYIGFSHCLDCAKHAYEQLEQENERLKAENVRLAIDRDAEFWRKYADDTCKELRRSNVALQAAYISQRQDQREADRNE